MRRFTRRHFDSGDLRVTTTNVQSFDRHIQALLNFWRHKWTPSKGTDTAAKVADNYRRVLKTALDLDLLFLPVLWQGDQPIALFGHILDPQFRRVHFIVAGRDETSPVPVSGLILHTQSIRWAIEHGYRTYDFCHGDEPYKYTFGAQNKHLGYFSIRRKAVVAPDAGFDPLSTTDAMRRLVGFIETGQMQNAGHAARQLLAVQQHAV